MTAAGRVPPTPACAAAYPNSDMDLYWSCLSNSSPDQERYSSKNCFVDLGLGLTRPTPSSPGSCSRTGSKRVNAFRRKASRRSGPFPKRPACGSPSARPLRPAYRLKNNAFRQDAPDAADPSKSRPRGNSLPKGARRIPQRRGVGNPRQEEVQLCAPETV